MSRLAAILVLALAAAVPVVAPAAAQEGHGDHAAAGPTVSLLHSSVTPAHLDVVVGDTVTWTNTSFQRHTVTSTDGTWSSDVLIGGERYARGFDSPASYAYFCRLHPGVQGVVAAHTAVLDAPQGAAAPRQPFVLTGRTASPAGADVTIEADAGDGYRPVGTAQAGSDGRFSARVTPSTTATYRAVAAGAAGPGVPLLVVDRRVEARLTRRGGRARIAVRVTPAAPKATVVLQLRLRERFGWWPVATARLNAASKARFTVDMRRRVPARVVLTLADGATPVAVSDPLRPARPSKR